MLAESGMLLAIIKEDASKSKVTPAKLVTLLRDPKESPDPKTGIQHPAYDP